MGHRLANGAFLGFVIVEIDNKTSVRDTGNNIVVITQQESCQPFLYRPSASIVF
jgi:hypothetical protein